MKKFFKINLFLLVILGSFLSLTSLHAATYDKRKIYSLEIDVNDPDSLEEIIEKIGLVAYDNGLDVSNTIVSVMTSGYIDDVLNQPTPSTRKLGSYFLDFQAEDSRGDCYMMEIIANVVDKEAPQVWTLMTDSQVGISLNEISKFGREIIERRVLSHVRGIDNHDLFDLDYSVDYSDVQEKNGTYNAYVTITDKSSNSCDYTMHVQIYDELKPRFEVSREYIIGVADDNYTASSIITAAGLCAYNSANNEVTVSLKEGENPGPYTTPGVYIIKYEAKEGSLVSSFDLYLEIMGESEVTFELDETVLVVSGASSVSSLNSRLDDLIKLRTHQENYTYEVVNDEYSENSETPGDYNYDLVVTFEDGREEEMHFVMRVISETPKEESTKEESTISTKKPSFFEKAWRIVLKAVTIIIGIFKWPFTLL